MEKTNEVYNSDYSYTIEDLGDYVIIRPDGIDALKFKTNKKVYDILMEVRGEDGIKMLIQMCHDKRKAILSKKLDEYHKKYKNPN